LQFNITDLIGVSFKDGGRSVEEGLDCLGLLILIYKRMGISVYDFKISCSDYKNIGEEYERQKSKSHWKKVEKPEAGCVLAMTRSMRFPKSITHFGIYIGNDKFIHCIKDSGVIISRISDPKYKNTIKSMYIWMN